MWGGRLSKSRTMPRRVNAAPTAYSPAPFDALRYGPEINLLCL